MQLQKAILKKLHTASDEFADEGELERQHKMWLKEEQVKNSPEPLEAAVVPLAAAAVVFEDAMAVVAFDEAVVAAAATVVAAAADVVPVSVELLLELDEEEEEVGSVTLSRPDTVLQLTEVVMSVKLSQAVNFFLLVMKAMIALSFTIRNCFRVLFAP